MEKLTLRQKQILDFIIGSVSRGSTPTIREIAKSFAISIGPAQKHLRALIKKGYLRHTPGISRGIDVSFRKALVPVPVVGKVPAGMPFEPLENAEDYVYVEKETAGEGSYFALKVKGDSMTGAGIMEDDIVVVRRQPVADDSDIVVAMIDGNVTVKRLRRKGEKIYLEAANPQYPSLFAREIEILGKVVCLSRKI